MRKRRLGGWNSLGIVKRLVFLRRGNFSKAALIVFRINTFVLVVRQHVRHVIRAFGGVVAGEIVVRRVRGIFRRSVSADIADDFSILFGFFGLLLLRFKFVFFHGICDRGLIHYRPIVFFIVPFHFLLFGCTHFSFFNDIFLLGIRTRKQSIINLRWSFLFLLLVRTLCLGLWRFSIDNLNKTVRLCTRCWAKDNLFFNLEYLLLNIFFGAICSRRFWFIISNIFIVTWIYYILLSIDARSLVIAFMRTPLGLYFHCSPGFLSCAIIFFCTCRWYASLLIL
mmetsp:Transcript_10135/g.24827  ORF Transcript_10135/g.24827 Transcript_10135/m.24827 type:complete len:281 (-) Transcript_10135:3040-3882(-)